MVGRLHSHVAFAGLAEGTIVHSRFMEQTPLLPATSLIILTEVISSINVSTNYIKEEACREFTPYIAGGSNCLSPVKFPPPPYLMVHVTVGIKKMKSFLCGLIKMGLMRKYALC